MAEMLGRATQQEKAVKLQIRRVLIVAGIVLAALFLAPGLINLYVNTYTDWLWFESVGYLSVYRTRLLAEVGTFLAGGLLALAFLGINWLLIPRRLLRHLQMVIRPRRRQALRLGSRALSGLLIAGGLVVALIMASAASSRWLDFLVFRHATPFGLSDPIFGLDAGFYVFKLPLYRLAAGWLLGLVAVALVGTTLVYGLGRGLREAGPTTHLSLLGALLLVLIAAEYQLARLGVLDSAQGIVFGAGYTDVHARLPIYNFLTGTVLLGAVALLVNGFVRRWRLLTAVGALWLAALVLGPIYPALVQRFVVAPNELTAERPYIEHNIGFTRYAFGLEGVREFDFLGAGQLTPQVLEANATTIDNIRLWDWRPLLTTYGQLQEIRLYYTFSDVDVDRYRIGGALQEVMLAARELDTEQLAEQAQTWVNRHLVFTHGYGACLSPVSEITEEGLPQLLVRDIPPASTDPALEISRPEIYFGEVTQDYIIVGTTEQEFDRPSGDENIYGHYEGPDGVPLEGLWRRLAFALRFESPQILFSSAIRPESRIHFRRQLGDRVQTLAPILWYDHDPYLVIADGRLVWLYDAYTWSDHFPYSEPFWGINYVRNSVKVAIDAYTGETVFYVVDPHDPIARTYQAIFPDLFTPGEAMDQALRDHWRYPEQLFQIQAEAYAVYHMEDPQVFYNKEDLWAVPTELREAREQEMSPYYVVMRLPEEEEIEFLMIRPYVPSGRRNMIAWLYADSDGEDYGQLGVFKFPKDALIYGPMQIEARFDQDPYISQQLTLWNQRGSEVIRGNLIVIPIDDTVLYVEPLYLQAEAGRLPELKRVLAAYANRVVMAEDLDTALVQVLTGAPAAEPTSEEPLSTDVAGLARSAQAHYEAAQACLQQGDWGCYGREIEAMAADLEALVEATKR
ncbi:MAG TPA: UPF0182 family protein [Chloroflexi bacterium]|nr:UPF0182 family protein [Chloroflexota bacterium]